MIAAVEEGREKSRSAAALPPLTGEGVVGRSRSSVLHARLLEAPNDPPARADRPADGHDRASISRSRRGRQGESRAAPKRARRALPASKDPLRDLQMRLTYRTVRVLVAISTKPGASNREVGAARGSTTRGKYPSSSRLEKLGLIENSGPARFGVPPTLGPH